MVGEGASGISVLSEEWAYNVESHEPKGSANQPSNRGGADSRWGQTVHDRPIICLLKDALYL